MATETELSRLTITDPKVMRALAHPARLSIIDHLVNTGNATATEAAVSSGLSPSATSYHLRELAKVGLVQEAPSRGDGRERVWRSVSRGFSVDADSAHDPEARSAERDLIHIVLARQDEQVRTWLEASVAQAPEWRDATAITEAKLILTAAELKDLIRRITELTEPYQASQRRSDAPDGARRASVVLRGYPTD